MLAAVAIVPESLDTCINPVGGIAAACTAHTKDSGRIQLLGYYAISLDDLRDELFMLCFIMASKLGRDLEGKQLCGDINQAYMIRHIGWSKDVPLLRQLTRDALLGGQGRRCLFDFGKST